MLRGGGGRSSGGRSSSSSRGGGGDNAAQRQPGGMMHGSVAARVHMTPSHIGDLDMLRVREAEKVILMEEELHGRYVRDEYGRIVPVRHLQRRLLRVQRQVLVSSEDDEDDEEDQHAARATRRSKHICELVVEHCHITLYFSDKSVLEISNTFISGRRQHPAALSPISTYTYYSEAACCRS